MNGHLCDIGVIGLGVMGSNLLLNIADHGFAVAGYNRDVSKVEELLQQAQGRKIHGAKSIPEFVSLLRPPRAVMLMVTAGKAVDAVAEELLPHLHKGDIIIDGGNSNFEDTARREKYFSEKGIHFLGVGVSGGESGARFGPSIMPGGPRAAYARVRPIFEAIAAKVGGEPCVTHIGPDGAGHFVKMIHNGIEYGDMQLICEAYHILRHGIGLSVPQLREVFAEWNDGELNSYLVEITAKILAVKDPKTRKPMVDVILDRAGQKGTGKWTVTAALDFAAPASTISEAVFARLMSALKDERVAASRVLRGPKAKFTGSRKALIKAVRQSLYASKICSYAQGFALMRAASAERKWDLDFGSIAMIWRGGCIIRAQFLHRIKNAYDRNPDLPNLLLDPYFKKIIHGTQENWRKVVSKSALAGIPAPAFSASLAYYDSYRSKQLPANLLQAQRDFFGAHRYERVDKKGMFHTKWE